MENASKALIIAGAILLSILPIINILSVSSNNKSNCFLSLIGSIPFNPDVPLPLKMFITIVSALSLLLCAVAILFDFVFSRTSSKNSYLIFLPVSSVPLFKLLAIFITSILFI